MKNLTILIFGTFFCMQTVIAQKFGYVDTEYILNKMPEYKKAQKEIDKLSAAWQSEIEDMYKDIDKMYKDYQAEEILLTEEMKRDRQEEIIKKEKEVKEHQKKIFGYEGLLFLKRQELIKPIQDEIFEAVQAVAKEKKLQVIFDKSGDLVMIYTHPQHDYTDYVLEELGFGDKEDTVQE